MILIGSRALLIRKPQAVMRSVTDFDFISTLEECENWIDKNNLKSDKITKEDNKVYIDGKSKIEFEIIQPGSSAELLVELVYNDPETIYTDNFGAIPNFDLLFTIKSSHKYKKNSPHFWKTFGDYHIMKKLGAKIRDDYKEFFKLREKESYNYAHPKLNQDKKSFFSDDSIDYVYDHDSIHEAVKLYDKPAYVYFKKDGAEVQVDKNKFFNCPREIQLASVFEESAVLAIERSLVPHPGVLTPEQAWRLALSKVLSSITSGWWREWAYENALDVLKIYRKDYFEIFQKAIDDGVVRPHAK